MSELLAFYQKEADKQASNIAWLHAIQKAAIGDFAQLGFPTRFHEEWKYTTVDSFLKQPFTVSKSSQENRKGQASDFSIGLPIHLQHGIVLDAQDAWKESLPCGVVIEPLDKALVNHPDIIQPYLNQVLPQQHAFQALNTAMLHKGLFIYVPKGVSVPTPLYLSHWQDKENEATYIRHLVVLEEESSACIIEDYQGAPNRCYFTNAMSEVSLASGAHLTHYKVQRESKLAYHIGHLAVRQAAKSQLDSHSFSFGGGWVRSDMSVTLEGEKARCLMNGVYLPSDSQHIDHHTLVTHQAPNCHSEQDYKGILSGHARAVFNGRVVVVKDAKQTDAKQQNKNILLSAHSEIDTKPQLEIFADDVVCTHGATVGQLDQDALFYLASRGISHLDAVRYLVQAFTVDNLRLIGHAELAEWLGHLMLDNDALAKT